MTHCSKFSDFPKKKKNLWLPISFKVKAQVLAITLKTLCDLTEHSLPPYLKTRYHSDLITYHSPIHSAPDTGLLSPPHTHSHLRIFALTLHSDSPHDITWLASLLNSCLFKYLPTKDSISTYVKIALSSNHYISL